MSKYVVIDLEMCNVPQTARHKYGYKQEIIQIGAVLLDENMEIADCFNNYVKPMYGALDNFIIRLTGISWRDLSAAPYLKEALADFLNWLPDEDVTIVSWSMTDKTQLLKEIAEKGIADIRIDALSESWLDCQPMFSEKLSNNRRYSLSEALVAADIPYEGAAHNGLNDARNTALLFAKMSNGQAFTLNPYYETARSDTAPKHLAATIGDLFAGIDLSKLAIA